MNGQGVWSPRGRATGQLWSLHKSAESPRLNKYGRTLTKVIKRPSFEKFHSKELPKPSKHQLGPF
jgi:hypothetical protein